MESRDQEHQLGCYFECVSTTPKTMPLNGGQCLHHSAGTRHFDEHLRQLAPLASFRRVSPRAFRAVATIQFTTHPK